MTVTTSPDPVRVYWQPGCTSCLRTKEFLTRQGVAFESRNVLEDESAFRELERFGLRQVPIVTRGDQWANGQVLADVARVVGIRWGGAKVLPVPELQRRLETILAGAGRFLGQLPDDQLRTFIPNRPRSYAELVYHIFNIADAFLEHEDGIPLTFDSYNRVPRVDGGTKPALTAYGRDVQRRLGEWFAGRSRNANWNAKANVYYGEQTLHEFLERTTWHSGQHTRQLMSVLEMLKIEPADPLGPAVFEGLPMPEKVWDDEKTAA